MILKTKQIQTSVVKLSVRDLTEIKVQPACLQVLGMQLLSWEPCGPTLLKPVVLDEKKRKEKLQKPITLRKKGENISLNGTSRK